MAQWLGVETDNDSYRFWAGSVTEKEKWKEAAALTPT